MKNYHVSLVYTEYLNYQISAEDEEKAIEQAWEQMKADDQEGRTYGEWETADVEEIETEKAAQ